MALELYRRFRSGETLEQIAAELGIPVERVGLRVRAAAAYWQHSGEPDGAPECRAGLRALCERVGGPT